MISRRVYVDRTATGSVADGVFSLAGDTVDKSRPKRTTIITVLDDRSVTTTKIVGGNTMTEPERYRFARVVKHTTVALGISAALGYAGSVLALGLGGGGTTDAVNNIQTTVGTTETVGPQPVSTGQTGTNVGGVVTTASDDLLGTGDGGQRAPEAVNKNTGEVIPNGSVMVIWTGDNAMDDGVHNGDFVSVIDAEPLSRTYGQVIWTGNLPSYLGTNNPGAALGHTSDTHNEPHHGNTYTQYIDPASGKKLLFTGGLISGNMFRFDITDPRAIRTAELAICGTELLKSSLTDDIFTMPRANPTTGEINMVATYMGGKSYGGPGTLVEFHPLRTSTCTGGLPYSPLNRDARQYLAEHDSVVIGGPKRYRPNPVTGNTDSGLEAYPHGMWFDPTGRYVATSDYAMPATIGGGDPIQNLFNSTFLNAPLSGNDTSIRMFGTTVRLWDANDLSKGPIDISQVPDGPRVEDTYFHEEPEGLMPFGMPHQPGNKGAFVASMCGGTIFYTSNLLSKVDNQGPVKWNAVWDVGPCSGVSVFTISDDDKYVVFPVAGIQSPGDPEYNRDYEGQHNRREIVLDIQPLIAKGDGPIDCDFPAADPTRPGNTSLGLPDPACPGPMCKDQVQGVIHNNGAPDCPVKVSEVVHNSPVNYAQHGGAHYTLIDRIGAGTRKGNTPDICKGANGSLKAGCRVAWSDYFVVLDHMGLQGTGSGGDRKIYMADFNPSTGAMSLDATFRDELTGEVGVNFAGIARQGFHWPNRGVTGEARPHAFTLERKGAVITEPWQQ